MIIDLHTHTRRLSPCSILSPEDMLKLCKEAGLDGVCFTEHDAVWSPEALKELHRDNDLVILRGMEVQTEAGHILVFGLEKWLPGIYRVDRLRQVVDEVGGVMILAHPFRFATHMWVGPDGERRRVHRPVEDGASKPALRLMDALEVLNGGSNEDENSFATAVADYLGLPGTGGSDAHYRAQVGTMITEFERQIETEQDLIRELKAGRFRARDLQTEPRQT